MFTNIHLLVKMVMALPCTTGPSERVFSCSGFLNPPRRSQLQPILLEILTGIRTFMNSPHFDFQKLFEKFNHLLQQE